MKALAIAATGMNAQEQNLEVIANNIANLNTTGFKRSRAEFTDLIYQTERVMRRQQPRSRRHGARRRASRARRAHGGGPHLANPRRADQHRKLARSRDQRARLVPSDDPVGRHRLYARRRVQHQRDGAIGDRRRLYRDSAGSDPANRDERHREPDGPGHRDDSRTDGAATARPVDDRQFHQRSRASGAGEQSLSADGGVGSAPSRRSRRYGVRQSCSRDIWKPRTSTRCRKSPT